MPRAEVRAGKKAKKEVAHPQASAMRLKMSVLARHTVSDPGETREKGAGVVERPPPC